jgi:hypothetical protein
MDWTGLGGIKILIVFSFASVFVLYIVKGFVVYIVKKLSKDRSSLLVPTCTTIA